jgi:hypothetical protein
LYLRPDVRLVRAPAPDSRTRLDFYRPKNGGRLRPMGVSKGKKSLAPDLTPEELAAIVRQAVARTSGVTGAALKKALPGAPKSAKEQGLEVARELAARNELVRWAKGPKECFFERDPIAGLDRLAREVLGAGPLTEPELKQRISAISPAHAELFADWKKGALGRRVLHEHASKPKRLGREPDIRCALSKALEALKKTIASLDALGVSAEAVAVVLRAELGLGGSQRVVEVTEQDRDVLLDALRRLVKEKPPGSLLSLRELRTRVRLEKEVFDATALALSNEGVVVLHHHDYPDSLSPSEKRELVQDGRGTSYVGIAPRGWS